MATPLSAAQLAEALARLADWTGDTSGIRRDVTCPSFPAAIELVGAVAREAELMNHHPDIDIRWRTVGFALSTHDAGGVTELDLTLAARIDALAAEL
ncbi:MAG TPA: 4a-hydroxytetrahydrobiopterin dehydratase [Mycobacteriales bacterium]|nr:4a-hydroxytetrahydrobiopterin dehydratase [Mycobacteriales bacterium]